MVEHIVIVLDSILYSLFSSENECELPQQRDLRKVCCFYRKVINFRVSTL